MTKMQIGWKAKDLNGEWFFFTHNEPDRSGIEWCSVGYRQGQFTLRPKPVPLKDHPEQPEIPWDKSLQPIYIKV